MNYRAELPIESGADEIFEAIQRTLENPVDGLEFFPVPDTAIALPFGAPMGVDVDFMSLKNGDLIYRIFNDKTEPLRVEFEFPQVLKDGQPLRSEFDLGLGINLIDTIDLSGFDLRPENDSIYFNYSATTAITGTSVAINIPFFTMKIEGIESVSYTHLTLPTKA